MLALSQVCSGQVECLILRQVLILASTDIIKVVVSIINKSIDTNQLVLSHIFRVVFLLVFFVKLDDDRFELFLVQIDIKMNLLLKAILVLPVVVVL